MVTTETSRIDGGFLSSPQPPPQALISHLSPVAPAFQSPIAGHEATAHEFEQGQRALGHKVIHPQQWRVQEVCDSTTESGAHRYVFVSVNVPRRSGKSESITGLALGRCLNRPGYRVAVTFLTTGTKLAARWKQDYFDRITAWAEMHDEHVTPVLSNGHEALKFGNGSVILLLPPRGSAFRSEAFDLVIADEAGEASEALSAAIIEAALPTLDTTGGQLLICGTPPSFRKGNILWDFESTAREGTDPDYGAVLYGVPYDLTIEDVETWEDTEPLIAAHHPGIGTLTTIDTMRRNYRAMGAQRFMREYLGQAALDQSVAGVIIPARWNEAEVDGDLPTLPDDAAVAFSVGVGDAFGAVAAAWRDEAGRAVVGLLAYEQGSAWLPGLIKGLAAKYPRLPLACDSKGTAAIEAGKAQKDNPRITVQRRNWPQVQAAAALLVREIHTRNFVHFGQEPLTEAALIASRRGEDKAFAFGRPDPNAQIAAIEAASLALELFDATPKRAPMGFTLL